jgi:tRNA(Ile)-lysidine synthetase-like protein
MYRLMVARRKPTRSPVAGRPTRASATASVADAVRAELVRGAPVVVAVSGGRDSMVLLEAIARVAPSRVAAVATFDHGTGHAATAAASLVQERARELGLPVRSAVSVTPASTEAGWRGQRIAFLKAVATELDARIVTAHTLDDHLETVLMRALRGAGARGLAGLLARSEIGRPFVGLSRSTIAACARVWSVRFVEDPTNLSRRHLRNRVRMDLLPALSRARPELPGELLDVSRRAADVRSLAEQQIDASITIDRRGDALVVSRDDLLRFAADELALLWPGIAARQGVTLDRRGTERLVSFTIHGAPGARIQLSGRAEAIRHRDRVLVRRVPGHIETSAVVPLNDGAMWGDWRFVRGSASATDRWSAELSSGEPLRVRGWRPGDRMIPEGSTTPRRLKGLFRDAGIDAVRRRRWPVVVAGERVVWVPGVRRASAAPARSGRPNVTFRCEHIDR